VKNISHPLRALVGLLSVTFVLVLVLNEMALVLNEMALVLVLETAAVAGACFEHEHEYRLRLSTSTSTS